jgi:signal peptidase II
MCADDLFELQFRGFREGDTKTSPHGQFGQLPLRGNPMNHRLFGFVLAAFIFFADQISKWFVLSVLKLEEVGQHDLLPFFQFTYTRNYGISGGFLTANSDLVRWALVAMTTAIAVGVAWWLAKEKEKWDRFALGLVLGGALGNILDRARLGYVVDFADLHFGDFRPFLIFNVGDAAISIGVAILLLRAFLVKKEEPKEIHEHA